MSRFVILFHSAGRDGDHYDLMLETPSHLETWQFASFPAAGVTCVQLPPHRKAYLTYEGPVSNNRGRVERVDEGDCEFCETPQGLLVKLGGKKIAGEFTLCKLTGDKWSFVKKS